ncbi:MAG: hypothetical protein HQL20_01025 [Candidatus Omnitrophica bacterium]|nr:hypothetical protein [Candidatus Omnitrophota bacterium]
MRRIVSLITVCCFILSGNGLPAALAQSVILPEPGRMIALSQPLTAVTLKGVKVYANDPLRLDFIIDNSNLDRSPVSDTGDQTRRYKESQAVESRKLIKYFLAALTTPEKDLWVNLSPYEKERIVPEAFGFTEMGRDLLAQDYLLKQVTASLIYPEGATGQKFWSEVYRQSSARYGTTDIPIDTFNKVWIVPAQATIYENTTAGTAYITKSRLKIMLETDYLATSNKPMPNPTIDPTEITKNILREIVIPVLEKEVNEGANFAPLRQVYNSLILAAWFKKKVSGNALDQAFVDRNKIGGININNPKEPGQIWSTYVEAFQKGVYNFIKEEIDEPTGEALPRKYFSGGAVFDNSQLDPVLSFTKDAAAISGLRAKGLTLVAALLGLAGGMYYLKAPTRNLHNEASPPEITVSTTNTRTAMPDLPKAPAYQGVNGFMNLVLASTDKTNLFNNLNINITGKDLANPQISREMRDAFNAGLNLEMEEESFSFFMQHYSFVRFETIVMQIRLGDAFQKAIETFAEEFPYLDGQIMPDREAFGAWMDTLLLTHELGPETYQKKLRMVSELFPDDVLVSACITLRQKDPHYPFWRMMNNFVRLIHKYGQDVEKAKNSLLKLPSEFGNFTLQDIANIFAGIMDYPQEYVDQFVSNVMIRNHYCLELSVDQLKAMSESSFISFLTFNSTFRVLMLKKPLAAAVFLLNEDPGRRFVYADQERLAQFQLAAGLPDKELFNLLNWNWIKIANKVSYETRQRLIAMDNVSWRLEFALNNVIPGFNPADPFTTASLEVALKRYGNDYKRRFETYAINDIIKEMNKETRAQQETKLRGLIRQYLQMSFQASVMSRENGKNKELQVLRQRINDLTTIINTLRHTIDSGIMEIHELSLPNIPDTNSPFSMENILHRNSATTPVEVIPTTPEEAIPKTPATPAWTDSPVVEESTPAPNRVPRAAPHGIGTRDQLPETPPSEPEQGDPVPGFDQPSEMNNVPQPTAEPELNNEPQPLETYPGGPGNLLPLNASLNPIANMGAITKDPLDPVLDLIANGQMLSTTGGNYTLLTFSGKLGIRINNQNSAIETIFEFGPDQAPVELNITGEPMKRITDKVSTRLAAAANGVDQAGLTPGGIDLGSSAQKVMINGNGQGNITVAINPALLQRLQNASGLFPVVLDSQPLESLTRFLGIQ